MNKKLGLRFMPQKSIGLGIAVAATLCAFTLTSATRVSRAEGPASRSASENAAGSNSVHRRQLDIHILGRVADQEGLDWPFGGIDGRFSSVGVVEECDVCVHLPTGKKLSLKTRPILIITRHHDTITGVTLAPATNHATMREKADEIDKLMTDWHAERNSRLGPNLDAYRKYEPFVGQAVCFDRFGGADPDNRTQVLFEMSDDGPAKFSFVAVLDAKISEWESIYSDGDMMQSFALSFPISGTRPQTISDVEVTLGGSISKMSGVSWPRDEKGAWKRSAVLKSPAALTLRLPGGGQLPIKSPSGLMLERVPDKDAVRAVEICPIAEPGSMLGQMEAVERVLKEWHANTTPKTLATIAALKKELIDDPTSYYNFVSGVTIGENCRVTFGRGQGGSHLDCVRLLQVCYNIILMHRSTVRQFQSD